MVDMDYLTQLLQSVPKSYDDFVSAMRSWLKDDEEIAEKIITFIKEDRTRTPSDVLNYMDELWGIDK